jgi:glutamate carboxypeptidase
VLKALDAVGALKDMHVTVVMTGDEERSGDPLPLARAALVQAAEGADYAIGFEDGASDPKTAVVSRRGSSQWELRVKGTPAHSSQIFTADVGAGAIYEASRILTEFYRRLTTEPNLTFNPGLILGGTSVQYDEPNAKGTAAGKDNIVAEHAVASGDLRALTPEQYDRAKRTMQEVVAQSLPRTSATLTFDDGYPPLAPSDANRALLALYDRASRDLGTGAVVAVDPRRAGAADVSFVAGKARMIMDGVGLMGSGGHTAEETADLRTLPTQTKRMALMLHRILKGSRTAS